jgi:hypothetical protein
VVYPLSRPTAKPRAMTPWACETIVESLRMGSYLSTALQLAGITKSCFHYWRTKVEAGDPVSVEEFGEFYNDVEVASARVEIDAIERLREGGPDWKAQARFLERRYPLRWSWAGSARRKDDDDDDLADDPDETIDEDDSLDGLGFDRMTDAQMIALAVKLGVPDRGRDGRPPAGGGNTSKA